MQEFWNEETKNAFLRSWRVFLADAPTCNATVRGEKFNTIESMGKGIRVWESVSSSLLSIYRDVVKEQGIPRWNEIRAVGDTLMGDIGEMVRINPLLKQGIVLGKNEEILFIDSFKTAGATAKNCEIKNCGTLEFSAFDALIDNVIRQVESDFERHIRTYGAK